MNIVSQQSSTVLVVDDTANTLELIKTMLGGEHRVLTASEAETGMKIALQEEPDLILLDIRMPGVDGYRVLPAAQGRPGHPRDPCRLRHRDGRGARGGEGPGARRHRLHHQAAEPADPARPGSATTSI